MKKRNKARYPSMLSAIMIVLLIFSSPGVINTVSGQELKGVNNEQAPPILITEIVPDSTDVNDADGYEFIEVYNNTDQVLNFGDYQIIYRYPVGPEDDLFWIPKTRDIDINPGDTLVLWIENTVNKGETVADFNANYGTKLVENEDIVKMPGGMSNQRMRDIIVRTNTGEEIVMAQYNKGTWDVAENMGIFYQYPQNGSKEMVKVSAGEKPATPGKVEPDLVPEVPVSIDANTTPTVENLTESSQPLDKVQVVASGEDAFSLSTMTLFYKNKDSENYSTLNLELDPEDALFRHTVPVHGLIGVDKLEYYFEASNGLNRTKTDIYTIDITSATNSDIPPLLITEIVPDSQNINGANAYEFIEVYNNTNQTIDFGDFRILYRGPTATSDVVWFDGLVGTMIAPGGNLVLWVENGKNLEATVDDFNANYGTTLVENIDIVKAPAGGGMANGAERDLSIATNIGGKFVTASYNKPGSSGDVVRNMGIFYHFPIGSIDMIKVRTGDPATPGTVEVDLVPADLISVDPQAASTIDNQTRQQTAKPGDSVQIVVDAQNDFLVTSMTMLYKSSNDETYEAVNLVRDPADGLFRHTINIEDDASLGTIDYYFVASNGFNETVSTTYMIDIDIDNIPDKPELNSPESGASDVSTDLKLSVDVSNPLGGLLDVSFYEGKSYNTSQSQIVKAYKNAVDVEPPAEMIPAGEVQFTDEDYSKVLSMNNEQIVTDSVEQFPYHRFEVALDEVALQQEMVEVAWQGSSLEGRKVSMYAWNFETSKWILVDAFVADSENIFSLSGEVQIDNYVRDNTLNVLVQDEIPPREEYDFSFVWLSDTQFYTEVFPELFDSQVQWIAENKDELNIEYVFHSGDIVNTYNQMYQWEYADQYMSVLEDADIPYGVLAGNHDIQLKPEIDYTNYYSYFGEDRFKNKPYFGGSYENNRGHYDLISTHGIDFIMVYMGWQPDDEGIAWMNEVLAEYPDRLAVLTFHQYLDANGKRSPMGEKLYQEVVLPNPNVQLVLGGHYHGSKSLLRLSNNQFPVLVNKIDDTGDGKIDREVNQLLGNFQDAHRGGDGYMNVMSVDASNNTILINTYSTDLDNYDLFEPYSISLDLEPKTKRVATDFFAVNAYTNQEIGTVSSVPNEGTAEILWEDLQGEQTYYWYASVRNEVQEEMISNMWHFSTEEVEEEIEKEITIGDLRDIVDDFIDSGDIQGPLANQLANTVKQAEHHYEKGIIEQAIKLMDKFLEVLEKEQMQEHVSPEAKAMLLQKANELLDVWHFSTEEVEEEIEKEITIGDFRALVDEFSDSGDIQGPLVNQLANTVKQAEHHYEKGIIEQAIKLMDKFLEVLEKEQMQEHVSPEAKAMLLQKANELLDVWR